MPTLKSLIERSVLLRSDQRSSILELLPSVHGKNAEDLTLLLITESDDLATMMRDAIAVNPDFPRAWDGALGPLLKTLHRSQEEAERSDESDTADRLFS